MTRLREYLLLQSATWVINDFYTLPRSYLPGKISLLVGPTGVPLQKDLKIKFARYERDGVREYWIVDPSGKTVQVFTRGSDGRYGRPQVFVDDDQAPVGILPEMVIDLGAVFSE
jgi:hypothetical protein